MELATYFGTIFSLANLGVAVFSTLLGIIIGAIPGLNGPIGVAVLLPLTFSMDPATGLIMLGGLYMGSTYGGSISAILLNCPGTSEAACTALDGYKMATSGRASEALQFSILASEFGGLFGCVVLLTLTPLLAQVALAFGPPEMCLIALAGLTFIGSMAEGDLKYSFLAVALGILFSTVGPDYNTGDFRFTLGINSLKAGIPLVPVIVGVFAATEMLLLVTDAGSRIVNVQLQSASVLNSARYMFKKCWQTLIRSTLIGTWIGILPGTGSTVASFVSYGDARRRNPEIGNGVPEGIVAPESANNAAVGGSLVPLLALGVPGSATAAIMYGALTIHNIIPGADLFTKSSEMTYTFIGGMFLSTICMGIMGIVCIRLFVQVPKARTCFVIPAVLVASMVGTYTVGNSITDLFLVLCFGCLGIIFRKTAIPIPPLLLGVILGPVVEQNLLRTMVLANGAHSNLLFYFVSRPVCLGCLLVIVYLMYKSFKPHVATLLSRNGG